VQAFRSKKREKGERGEKKRHEDEFRRIVVKLDESRAICLVNHVI